MSDEHLKQVEDIRAELKNFEEAIRARHDRVNPCFMTGKGCVYTDQIDQTLELRRKQRVCNGFMVMPFRPKLRVFFQNCLRPFFYENYDRDPESGNPASLGVSWFALERADDVSRPGVIICEGICKRIQESDFVVADISVPNDNVFYELGLAYGIGHKIILIHQLNAKFGTAWAKYLRASGEHRVKEYDGLQMINREQFKVSQYVWKREDTSGTEEHGDPEVLFLEMMANGEKEPDLPPTGMEDEDIGLLFRTHVMSDIGLALNRIAFLLRKQEEKDQRTIPHEYLSRIIGQHLDKAHIVEPGDTFEKTRKRVDKCYCLIVRTGMDCHPMSYFWLGYGHARGKNVIPITQLVLEEGSHPAQKSRCEQIIPVDSQTRGHGADKARIADLAFDIRAQRHMTFDPLHPELLEHQVEQTLREMIHTDFSQWSRKRFWAHLLGSRGEVSIITGGLHSEDHNREMIGDWDLRAASELTSYFSRHQYRPKIETPIYQPEFAKKFDGAMTTKDYIQQVTDEIRIAEKNCVVIASPDVNPLTEILLGRLNGVKDEELFSHRLKAEDYPAAIIVCKSRKKTAEPSKDESPTHTETSRKTQPTERAFYQEVTGKTATEARGFRSRGFARTDTRLQDYFGQNEYQHGANKPFNIYAQLVVARNPFTPKDRPPRYVIILNGVSGPATFALTHVLTGGGNEEFESYKRSEFDPAAEAESILNKFLGYVQDRNFTSIECVVNVAVGKEPRSELTEDPGHQPGNQPKASPVGAGATFDWRRILSWTLDKDVLGTEIRKRDN